ncbi:ATP synthase [Salix suchowensis]|nr:ATP synthase [Salix suchowensis]
MGGERKKVFVGLMVAMILGFAVYFRLWTIDYAISSDDTELIRRQFDLANREASDESAEWRMKYDEEVERAAKCDKQLVEIKQKVEDAATINQQMVILQKENMALVGRMEALKNKLEATKLKCRSKLDR